LAPSNLIVPLLFKIEEGEEDKKMLIEKKLMNIISTEYMKCLYYETKLNEWQPMSCMCKKKLK
jgi:hypothetical protein